MKATQKFIFVNENNYRQVSATPVDTVSSNIISRNIIDRFRQIIGNYWYPIKPSGAPIRKQEQINDKATLAWHERKRFPFKVQLGKTHTFSSYKIIPTILSSTPITLVADSSVFGPYPSCTPCWFRYLYGYDMNDFGLKVDKVFNFEPLKIQEIESTITVFDPSFPLTNTQQAKLGAMTPLSVFILGDVGLPTTQRLSQLGVDISYLSFGNLLIKAIEYLNSSLAKQGGIINYNAKLFRDSKFENEISLLDEAEQNLDSDVDYALNSSVKFTHNYTASEYEEAIATNRFQIPTNIDGETRLVNMYEAIFNGTIRPELLRLENQAECTRQKIFFFFRPAYTEGPAKTFYTLAESVPLINKFYPFENLLPYNAKITFKLQTTGPIAGALEETRNDGLLMRHIQENRASGAEINNFRTFKQTLANKKKSRKFVSLLLEERRDLLISWEFYEWLLKIGERINNKRVDPLNAEPIVDTFAEVNPNVGQAVINQNTPSALSTRGIETPDENYAITTAALHMKVASIIKMHHRSYPQLLRGDKPHQEVLAYKISKYSNLSAPLITNSNQLLETTLFETLYGDEGFIQQQEPIQEFWFFNTTKEEIVKYVDTQIRSDRFYTYVVNAYVLVLDSEYYYTNVGNTLLPCQNTIMDFEPASVSTPTEQPDPSSPEDPGFDNTPIVPPLKPVITIAGSPGRATTVPGFGQAGREPGDAGAGGGPQGLGPGVGQIG